MEYVGIDLSLRGTGLARLTEDGGYIGSKVIKPKYRGYVRLAEIRDKIIVELPLSPRDCKICIEGYSYMSSNSATFPMGELGGVVRLMLVERGYLAYLVPPSSLKKFVTSKGNAPKDLMILKTYKKYGWEFSNNNECDAFGLAQMAWAMDHPKGLTKYEVEALKAISKMKDKGRLK